MRTCPSQVLRDRGWTGAFLLTGCPDSETQTSTTTPGKAAGFAYVANTFSDNVSVYTINQTTGALVAVGTPIGAGTTPSSLALASF